VAVTTVATLSQKCHYTVSNNTCHSHCHNHTSHCHCQPLPLPLSHCNCHCHCHLATATATSQPHSKHHISLNTAPIATNLKVILLPQLPHTATATATATLSLPHCHCHTATYPFFNISHSIMLRFRSFNNHSAPPTATRPLPPSILPPSHCHARSRSPPAPPASIMHPATRSRP
jgi:hypothetical protein